MILPELLEILRCPETMQRVGYAPPETLARVAREALRDRAGNPAAPLEAGLLREDGALLYPIRHGIPIMLIDEAIVLP